MKSIIVVLLLATPLLARTASADGNGHRSASLAVPAANPAKAIDSRVVADTPHVKSVVITVRKGATLTEHSSPHAAVIQALSGQGQVRLGKQLEKLSATQMVLLDPGVKHEVIADKAADLVLLVHHMKSTAVKPGAAPAAPHHDH